MKFFVDLIDFLMQTVNDDFSGFELALKSAERTVQLIEYLIVPNVK